MGGASPLRTQGSSSPTWLGPTCSVGAGLRRGAQGGWGHGCPAHTNVPGTHTARESKALGGRNGDLTHIATQRLDAQTPVLPASAPGDPRQTEKRGAGLAVLASSHHWPVWTRISLWNCRG